MTETDVAIIGAGPIGLELAVNLREAGVRYLHFDAGNIGQTVTWYPKRVQFFSSPERIAIAGVPLNTADQTKATREEYLAYLRGIVEQFDLEVRTYERVVGVTRVGHDDGVGGVERSQGRESVGFGAFEVRTLKAGAEHVYRAKHVVLAIGDMHRPRKLGIEGEDLPHVSHYFDEPHAFFQQRLLIVGGRNSAVEAAIRCHRAGAKVAISYRQAAFAKSVKYWIKPEVEWLIQTGAIDFYPCTVPVRIRAGEVELADASDAGAVSPVPADFVLLLVGYEMDTTLLEQAGVELRGENRAPVIDPRTMQTNVPGLFVAGTAVAGTQVRFKLFIENAHPHVIRIMRSITGRDPRHMNPLGWSRLDEDPLQEQRFAET